MMFKAYDDLLSPGQSAPFSNAFHGSPPHAPDARPRRKPRTLAFLFIGGEHQVLHLAPVAARISIDHPDIMVRCVCADPDTARALSAVAATMHANAMAVEEITPPVAGRLLSRLTGLQSAAKGPLLAKLRWHLRESDAIIVPERTSSALRKLGWRRPLIHFRHGAGDRAPASEAKLRAFDFIFVPGQKDIDRAVAQGLDRSQLATTGYIKMDYLRALGPMGRLFDDQRPVILYNPHFDARISSLPIAREVIAHFAAQERYNLVFAPHIRSFENLTADERAEWKALAVPGRIIVDLDSPRLFDMSYTRAADLYLGDMSSQLYEFLVRPRPAVFLNAHQANWRDDPRYAGWHLGEVASGAEEAIAAIDRAFERQPERVAAQRSAVGFAFGAYEGAIARAADQLLRIPALA